MTRFLLSCFLVSTFGIGIGTAQPVKADTMKASVSQNDTTKRTTNTSIDTLVNYTARDSIIYSLRTRYMNLYGKSELQYQTIGLKSERVNVNWDDATLVAYGAADTIKADSIIGKPIMRDGGSEYHGDQVRYNFRTRKGKIKIGTTQMENGYYVGTQIKKVEPDVLCIADGTYTTCDDKDPHFYFESPKMKVFVRDQVVAEPVFFFVAGVPIFALPFGVFPAHGGRSSGIITPAYGEDATYGWYLSHIGYYWAVSDYWDIASMFDIYSRGRWQNQTNIHYALRYNLWGNITARITSTPIGDPSDPNYNKSREYYINITHGQTISPSSRLDVNFTFMSTNYFKNFSTNLSDILLQNVISDATYWKSWESSNSSLTINAHRDQSLITGQTNEQLPSISFSQGTIYPFSKVTKTRGLSSTTGADQSFIEMLGFGYTAQAINNQSKVPTVVDSAKLSPSEQNFTNINDFLHTKTQSLSQGLSFLITPPKLGYFNVAPSLSFTDARTWGQNEKPFRDTTDSLLAHSTSRTKNIVGNVNTGVNVSTKLFGMFQPNLLGVTAIRHTMTPTFGLFYKKQIYGDNMQKYSMTGSFDVGNNFEMKTQKNDSAKTEDKVKLFNIDANVNYNFAADSMGFSDVGFNYRTDIGQYLNIGGRAIYNLYVFDPTALNGSGARVNRFLLEDKGKFGDLTSFSLSLSTSFKGEKKQKPSNAGIPDSTIQEQEKSSGQTMQSLGQKKVYYSPFDQEDADFSIPWNISVYFNFSQLQPTPQSYSRSSSVNASLSFNLTEKWQIALNGISYDFVSKKPFIQSVSVTRDLHCWQMNFSWYPMGYLEGYRFELKVKAPQLQDIKVTKQSNNRGVAY
jgi:lipopolysaccharide assembly outer membrane protein LptD (OstA)